MTAILAIETATDACSVALYRDGHYSQRHEVLPRQHNQRLFSMLGELLPAGSLRDQGIDALAYGCGPGSFTGLRIAASAVQGLAFASNLPALPVSTLACQVATALRQGSIDGRRLVLSTLDARINEVYWAIYLVTEGAPALQAGPFACAPSQLQLEAFPDELDAVGSGCGLRGSFPKELCARLATVSPEILPEARDLVPLALDALQRGEGQQAMQVQPVYVRDEISWKKISEQGKGQ
jgi:tRNA threonylcarbamoyladenosine biosynthesis protein TsaB